MTVFRSFAHPPCPVLATGKAKGTPCSLHRLTLPASSFPVALLSAGEGVVTNTAGSCWRRVVDFLWSPEWCTDQCDFLFCWLWACWAEQESWLLSSPCREANSTGGEWREQWELEEVEVEADTFLLPARYFLMSGSLGRVGRRGFYNYRVSCSSTGDC